MSRKALTATVVAATIAWSIGLSALLAPLAVKAAPASGSLIKGSLAAVYYVGADGKRYVFPHEKTYKTWYVDFSGVMLVTDAELAALPIGGNVTHRPGVKLVKIQSDPKTYAVAKGGTLRWVTSEALAVSLYGSDWNTADTEDVSDAFFTNYTVGADITNASQYSPAGETSAATSINSDKNLGSSGVSGTLSASLSAGQPAGGSLPKGANNVAVLKIDVRNGGSAALTVDSLTAHRSGTGVVSDISNAYVYAGNDRLTTGRSFNSTTHDASFSGLNLTLGAGETKTLWLGVDFSATAASSNVHAFSVTDLKSGTSTAAGLPLSGPTFTISGATAGSVTVAKSGSITNPKAGQLGAKIGEFQLNAGSAEDINFSKVALYQGGSLSREKFSNLVLKQAGATLATTASLNSKDLAVFAAATPILIEKGNTKTFEVYADIAGSSRSAETVKVYLDQTTDLLAIGATYGYGVSVTNPTYDGGACTSAAGDCSFSTVEAGQLTITFNGPAAKDVASNGKDVELFNFTMAAQSNLEVRKMQLLLDGDGDLDDGLLTSPRVTDIKVVDTATGATVSGPKDATSGTGYAVGNNSSTLDFTEVFNLTAGQARTFKVTADIANSTTLTGGTDLTTVKVTLKKFSALSAAIRNLDTSQDLAATDYVPDADIAGNTHSLKNPSLTFSLASTPVSQTYIQGVQGAQMFGLNLKAGDASDVKVNTIKLTAYVDSAPPGAFTKGTDGTATASDMILTGSLWNGSTQVGSTKSPSSGAGGEMTFDNLNLTILKGQTTSLTLKTNVAASIASLVANSDTIKFDIANKSEVNADAGGDNNGVCAAGESCTTTDITATDPDGNSIDPKTTGLLNDTTVDAGTRMTLKSAGSVTVALASDDTESEAGLLVGGAANAVLAKFRLTATDEELKLTKARMVVAGPTAVTNVSLYDGATLVGGPVSVESNGNADFSSMNFVIPKDGSKVLTVKGNLNTVGSSGALSGTLATTTFDNAGSTQFEVRGTSAGSSTLITTVGTDTAGRQKVLRKTKPTISLVSLPTTTLTSGEVVAMRFTVTADAAEQVSLKALTVTMAATAAPSVAVSAASSIRRVGDSNNLAGASAVAGAGCAAATAGACTLTASFTNEEVISAGTSKTYDVRLTIGGTLVTGDSLSSKLDNEPAVVVETGWITSNGVPAFEIDTSDDSTDNGTLRLFIWSDNSASPHLDPGAPVTGAAAFTTVSKDWTNGSYLKVLPTDTQTLTK